MSKIDLSKEPVTPEKLYLNRRFFLQTSIYASTALVTAGAYRFFRQSKDTASKSSDGLKFLGNEKATDLQNILNYNNFYEFSTDKEAVAQKASNWKIPSWNLSIEGMVENPYTLNLSDINKIKTEERIYRFRCVEGWSMVIPWQGFPLYELIERAKPLGSAKYVAFETYYNEADMPEAGLSGIAFPYVEGLRLDEALHPLTLIATGIYGKNLANQNGAPLRLVVPWKYGFKSIKSIVKITLTDKEPPTSWNIAIPNEYGFYSNVNPSVDHPRWSQASERRIGEYQRRETLPFNGYADEVEKLYQGMDLRKFF
ncbi:MAG: protein-methionine-sulfoxide reductase catalytic subunit MsrP [Bdellovibrionales bacterium]|nr:protein-methionine-sulfoxide reductase catalytic subunit MsrP [Bdellovibrionales bacterium]